MDSRDAANRDLLIGLFALQTGMVDQDVLIAAFRTWTRDKSRPIAEILAAQGAIDADDRSALEVLVAKHIKRHGDDAEKSLAAVPTPRSVVNSLAVLGDPDVAATLGHVGSKSHPTEPDAEAGPGATLSVGGAPSNGQRFRVLRPHARGGLGAVFVALDEELHREVALKQILDHHADDPTSRTRFVMEAEITGGLEHPGIVPVYGLGTYGDGRPYYAMRFVRGDSLKDAIATFRADETLKADPGKRSLALRKLLRRFVDVCNAIDYAHTRGVLHRDIKPANVIVGKHGETLVVDWGLAKMMGKTEPSSTSGERTLMPSSASGSAETLPGSAMGTPAYLSPEQGSGDLDRLGARSDVYGLGATLYCLLTGKPPFEDDDLGAVLRAVQKGDFPSPRTADPTIDRALEAVCLKAMALKPADRYATPKALAEDVERWAADEPVSAWREPLARRARRWGRRNRTVVTAGAVAVLALLFGTAAVLAVQTRANGVLKQSNLALAMANARETKANASLSQANNDLAAAKDREAARFGLAMEAIKLFHGEVGDDLVLKADQFKPLRDKLLKGAADFYGKLEGLLKGQPDRSSRGAMGNAYFELGELTEKIGDKSAALAVHRKALAVRRELASEPDADAETRGDVAKSLRLTASLLSNTGNSAEALACYEEARDLLEGLPRSGPGSDERGVQLGRAYLGMGSVLASTGKTAAATSAYQRALAILQKLADDNPAVTDFQNRLASSHIHIGNLQSQTGHPAEALETYRRALAIWQKLTDDNPAVTEFRNSVANTHLNSGLVQSQTGHPAEELESDRRALAILQKLAADNPAVTDFQNRLAHSHHGIAVVQSQTGHTAEALESYLRAQAIWQKLADDNPTVTDFQNLLATSHYNIAILQSQTGHTAEALQSYQRAVAIEQKLADDNPTVTRFQDLLATSHLAIGWLLSQSGQPGEALASYRRVLTIRQKLADDNPTVTDFRSGLAWCHKEFGRLLRRTGRSPEAETEYRKALSLFQKLVDDNPIAPNFRDGLASVQNGLGSLLGETGRSSEAETAYHAALAIYQKLVDDNPTVTRFRSDQADVHTGLGLLMSQTGRPSDAEAEFRKSLAINQKLADDEPRVLEHRRGMTRCLNNIGDLLTGAGRPSEAVEVYERARAILDALMKVAPSIDDYRSGLAFTLSGLGRARRRAGERAAAVSDLRRAVALREGLATVSLEARYGLACNHSLLAALATEPGSDLPAAEGRAEAERAMAVLKRAIAEGYRSQKMSTDPDLEALRARADFRLLMLDESFPANPFAR